ncbi:concanavalin A-like lectin/glucanase domain-containing protein [Gigaspora rosea]|uniref:Concanavalin A-like lectin/glucanase domain-containing protein n=1 Tax=Gigaspora rosea TaxID=44941 RepID=A0A397VV17_9GLOM|nr:concanavalin A-like lectin/glucanase domain-containing protein [Gigaspora rosea]
MIGIGFCTKTSDQNKYNIDIMPLPGQENNSWGYHGDDGYLFCSGSGESYGPSYTIGDTIGCYLNFKNRIAFYTKNGINLGIACHLPDDLEEGSLYPCVGFRSQGGFIEANFGDRDFEYSVMTNKDISNHFNNQFVKTESCCSAIEYQEKIYFIKGECEEALLDLINKLTESLKKNKNNTIDLIYRGKIYFIIGKYEEALEDLTKLLEIEQDNIVALSYRGEIYYMMKRYNDSIADLKKLLKIVPHDAWANETSKLIEDS